MSKILKFNNGMHFVMVDERIVGYFLSKGSKEAICTVGGEHFHCAFMITKRVLPLRDMF